MKIALVTGASSGIGREFALQIPKLYHNLDEIWVVARRAGRLEKLKEECRIPVRVFDGDLEDGEIYGRIEKNLKEKNADIRMLVNAAGYGKNGTAETIGSYDQCAMVELNVKALTKMTLLCLPYLSMRSRIINIASAAAFCAQPGFAVYAATKSYVYSFSQALRQELKSRQVIVTVACPGPVDTEFFERAGSPPNEYKSRFRADAWKVAAQALEDSVKCRAVSVYGKSMKCTRVLAKLLPDTWTAYVMKKVNQIN